MAQNLKTHYMTYFRGVVIAFFVSFMNSSLYSQGQFPAYSDIEFIGRFINWNTQLGGYPFPAVIEEEEPLLHSSGFHQSLFYIPLLYDQSIAGLGWDGELVSAVNTWNSQSSMAKLTINSLGGMVNNIGYTNPPQNTVSADNSGVYFAPNDAKSLAFTRHQILFKDKSDCNDSDWPFGPIIISADIVFNNNGLIEWYVGDLPQNTRQYHVSSVALHEFGHFLGLNHYTRFRRNKVMNRQLRSAKRYHLRSIDVNAINRLYGYDGMLGGGNNFFSSIPCQDFNPIIVHPVLGGGPEGEPTSDGGSTSPCENCAVDPGEDGINCGLESGCGVLCQDLCSYDGENIVINDYETPIYDYTIAKNTVKLEASKGSITIPSGDFKYIKAGEFIDAKPGLFSFDTGVLSEVEMVIGDCSCPEICSPVLTNVMTPNCDEINDFLSFAVNGASSYEFIVQNRWERTVYSKTGSINYADGNQIVNWAGQSNSGGMVSEGVYFYTLRLFSSCSGASKEFVGNQLSIFDPQECNLDQITKRSNVAHTTEEIVFEYYPNPVKDNLLINSHNALINSISLSDMQGKKLEDWVDLNVASFKVDLGKYGQGAFIVTINTNKGRSESKIITKE